jgi:small-conductance mechanosensitive channel
MAYWQAVDRTAGVGVGLGYLTLAILGVALGLLALAPAARRRSAGALLIYSLGAAGLLIAAALATWGPGDQSAPYKWARYFSLLLLGIGIINLAGIFLFRVLLARLRLEPPPIMRDLILAAAYAVLAISLLTRMGVNLTGIVATSAVVTAVIGFSLADTLGNIMGGMALQMERSIVVGDWVRVGQHEGMVKEIRWRQTTSETRSWDTVIIPNSQLMKSDVTVLGRREGRPRQSRQSILFNVDFRHSPTEVIDTVETALRAEQIPGVATEPPPNCIVTEFRDSYAVYALRYWLTDLAANDPTSSAVRARIFTALRRAGISLSIPAQTVFLTGDDERRRRRKESEDLDRRLTVIAGIELFAPLTDDEKRHLAARLRPAPFIRGETITRQGATAHWLYILTRGTAEVRVSADDRGNGNTPGARGTATVHRVATLNPGDVFGEMGLMTGEPRSATVVADTDVTCHRLDKDAFMRVLKNRPEVAEAISRILARRRAELDAVREGLNEQATRARARSGEADLLRRIKAFFTLD